MTELYHTHVFTLKKDQPLFNANTGDEVKVNLEFSPSHGELVLIQDPDQEFSIRRYEYIDGRSTWWPPLEEIPLIMADILVGTVMEIRRGHV